MSEAGRDFAELLGRVRLGDEAAWITLVQLYEPKVRLVAHYLLGSHLRRIFDSIDIVQSVHFDVARGLKEGRFKLSGPDNLVALAVAIVRRKVAQRWRHLRHEHRIGSAAEAGRNQTTMLLVPTQASDDPARVAQLHLDLAGLLLAMDDTERHLLELRLQGYSTEEAASEMGVAANVLRVLLSRLRRRLRDRTDLTDWL